MSEAPKITMPELPAKELDALLDRCVQIAYGAGHHFAQHGKHAPSLMMSQADAQANMIRKFQALHLAAYLAGMEAAAQIAESTIVAEYEGVDCYGDAAAAAIRRAAEGAKED